MQNTDQIEVVLTILQSKGICMFNPLAEQILSKGGRFDVDNVIRGIDHILRQGYEALLFVVLETGEQVRVQYVRGGLRKDLQQHWEGWTVKQMHLIGIVREGIRFQPEKYQPSSYKSKPYVNRSIPPVVDLTQEVKDDEEKKSAMLPLRHQPLKPRKTQTQQSQVEIAKPKRKLLINSETSSLSQQYYGPVPRKPSKDNYHNSRQAESKQDKRATQKSGHSTPGSSLPKPIDKYSKKSLAASKRQLSIQEMRRQGQWMNNWLESKK